MPSSTCGFEQWIPAPESWPTFPCRQCEASMQVPFAPSDGLCAGCRQRAREVAAEEARQRAAKPLDQRLLEVGAPRKFSTCTRQQWESRYGEWREHDELRRLVGWPHDHQEDSWLLFITRPDVDDLKTELATAVLGEALIREDAARAALARGPRGGCKQPVRWASQADWLRQIKASWSVRARHDTPDAVAPENVVWRQVAEASVLLFDEFGGLGGGLQFEKPWWRSQVSQLLHHRECHRLPTIVTARFADWRQVEQIDEALLTRLDVPLKISLS